MKKAQDARPNQQLKQARELRGWSQSDVAQQLNVDHYYLALGKESIQVFSSIGDGKAAQVEEWFVKEELNLM